MLACIRTYICQYVHGVFMRMYIHTICSVVCTYRSVVQYGKNRSV